MNFDVIPSKKFRQEAKRLVKKYLSLKSELIDLSDELSKNPKSGVLLRNNIYKIRIAIRSKGKGKSGGSRVITYVVNENKEVYLLTIYDKSEFDQLDEKSIQRIIDSLDANI